MPNLRAIAAMSENRVIGVDGKIPWRLPEDFRFFRKMTLGRVVLMGRLTYESLGKPLPGRLNVVLTRNPEQLMADPSRAGLYRDARVWPSSPAVFEGDAKVGASPIPFAREPNRPILATSFESARTCVGDGEVWVIGGAAVYAQLLPECSDLYLTHVKRVIQGDAVFPAFEHLFEAESVVLENTDFRIVRYVNRRGLGQ